MEFYHYALFGFFGGIIRSFVGILKALKRKEKLRWDYALLTIILSAFIGMFAGMLYTETYIVSMISGYAGMDILEGLYKTIKPTS